jgi:hypothetical protein
LWNDAPSLALAQASPGDASANHGSRIVHLLAVS